MTNAITRDEVETARVLAPRALVTQEDEAYVLAIEVPGADESSVELTVEDGVLTVVGRPLDAIPDGYRAVHVERGLGVWKGRYRLPEGVDTDEIAATVSAGVLKVTLPKLEPSTKRIEVRSEEARD